MVGDCVIIEDLDLVGGWGVVVEVLLREIEFDCFFIVNVN